MRIGFERVGKYILLIEEGIKNWKFGQDSVVVEGIGKEGVMFSNERGWNNWKFGQDSVLIEGIEKEGGYV